MTYSIACALYAYFFVFQIQNDCKGRRDAASQRLRQLLDHSPADVGAQKMFVAEFPPQSAYQKHLTGHLSLKCTIIHCDFRHILVYDCSVCVFRFFVFTQTTNTRTRT